LEGIERSRAAAVSTDGSADRDGFFGQWGRIVGRRQSGQVALIGRARDFHPAKEVGDASTQRIPGLARVGAGFRRAIDPQVFGMVDGRLWPQNVEAVVKLDRVMVDPVLETNSFGTAPQIRHDFSPKFALELLAQKTHDLLTAQIEHAVPDQMREEPIEGGLVSEEDITGKLRLGSRPVVAEAAAQRPGNFLV